MKTKQTNKAIGMLTGLGIMTYALSIFAQCAYYEYTSNDCDNDAPCQPYYYPGSITCDYTGQMTQFSGPGNTWTNKDVEVYEMDGGHCTGGECHGGTQGPHHYETIINQECKTCDAG